MKKIIFALSTLILLASFVVPSPAKNNGTEVIKLKVSAGRPFYAELSGAQETGAGDPDGSGWVELTLNQGQGTITYTLSVQNIDPAAAAHIHVGAAGVAGPVVVHLEAPTNGMSSGVEEVDPELIKAIRQNPENYYVNVHNSIYPAGAVRGQLSK
jgi:hypothetical protein